MLLDAVHPMVLLDDVVEVLRLTHLNRHAAVGLNAYDGGPIGAALIDGDLLGHAVQVDRAFEKCPRRGVVPFGAKQKVDRVADLVDCSVQVLPLAADLDVGFVHPPAIADRQLTPATHRREHRQHLHRPAMDRRVVDRHSTLGHHFFEMPQAQRVRHVPANAHQHDLHRIVQPADHFPQ